MGLAHRLEAFKQRVIRSYYKAQTRRALKLYPRACPLCSNADLHNFKTLFEKDRYGFEIKTQKCGHCGLVMINPAPTEKFLENFYSSKQYRGLYLGLTKADVKNNDRSFEKAQKNVAFINEHLTLTPDAKILDIGSAYGGYLIELKRNNPHFQIYGVEPGSNFAEKNKTNFTEFYSSVYEIPQDERFDLITLWHVLEHIYDPIRLLTHIKSILLPEGKLVIEVPDYKRYKGIRNIHLAHLFHFDSESLAKIAEKTGFTIDCISYENLEDEPYGMKVILKPKK